MIHLIDDGLTERRREMLHMFSRGLAQKAIAAHYGVCVGTVKAEKFKIIRQIGRDEFRKRVFRNG